MPGRIRLLHVAVAAALTAGTAALTAGTVAVAGPAVPAFAASTATINGGTTYQTITGFGASEAFGEAATVMGASSAVQTQALNLLYGTSGGAGLTILRNEISADSGDTIEPAAPSSPSAAPSYVSLASINQDMGQLWFAQQIKARFGVTNVFADAWSAPAFMKTNDSADNGGAVCGMSGATCGSGNWEQAYANYLKQYAADYATAGDPLTYVGPENEANLSTSYDSMQITPAQTAQFLDVLGPAMAGTGTGVECCATEGWNYAQQYAAAIEADPTASADTAVFTSHGYTEAPTTPLTGWSKPAFQTEWSTFETWDPAWDDGTDASGLTWAQHIFAGLDSANLNAFLYWWGSTTPSENGDNEGLIQINGSTVIPSGRLWAFGNFSDFVRPGAVRIGATTTDGNLTLDAFKNTNGQIAIVALNTASSADTDSFALSGTGTASNASVTPYLTNSASDIAAQPAITSSAGAFTATIPARSLETFVVGPCTTNCATGNTVTVTNPGSQSANTGTAVSLPVKASDSASGQTLTYSATGLPAGLSISSSTGVISGTPTTAATYHVTVTATDTTGASGSASFTWTINPANTGSGCQVTYTPNQWQGGFTADVTIANTGSSAIDGWKLTFTFPGDQQITDAWNGLASQSGENVTITNETYNATIAAGSSTSLGFQGTWTSSDAAPASFSVNGATCT